MWRKRYDDSAGQFSPGEWGQGAENGNLRRIFAIVLLLHVAMIGGAVLYHLNHEWPDWTGEVNRHPPPVPLGLKPGDSLKRQAGPRPSETASPDLAGHPVRPSDAAPHSPKILVGEPLQLRSLAHMEVMAQQIPLPPGQTEALRAEAQVAAPPAQTALQPKSGERPKVLIKKKSPSHAMVKASLSRNTAAAIYKVKGKDTYYSISRRFGVSVSALMKLNHAKDPNRLRTGAVLKIPRHRSTVSNEEAKDAELNA